MSYILELAQNVKDAQNDIAKLSMEQKNNLLSDISIALINNTESIIEKNKLDLANAKENGITDTMIDRLMLNESRIKAMANGVIKVMSLQDPIGEVIDGKTIENGLQLIKKRVPLGVVGMIYESRPNVTVDAGVLCLKSSNAVILRGGKEAINTNVVLGDIMRDVIKSHNINPNILAVVNDTTRETANEMMKLNGYIDVLIPRGGASLIDAVVKNATVPVIETGVGNCHIYLDKFADLKNAIEIVYNAKVSRPSVCNACETVLIHVEIADQLLPKLKHRLDTSNVVLVGCEKTIEILGKDVSLATDVDYATEFLDYKLAIKIVSNIDMAIEHIRKYSTKHSEAIITENLANATKFTEQVDAAVVYINASTRFTDGEVFGLGAEIGISTQKLHVRGPMGLKELTSTKYIIHGNGNVR